MLRRWRRRWLADWEAITALRLAQWPTLDDDERVRLGRIIAWLVRTKHWEAARGFALTPEVVVAVAAHAALLVLELDTRVYRDVRAIVIHRSTITRTGPRATSIPGVITDAPQHVLGHAVDRRGPVAIAWDAARRDMERPERGQNVVFHEFAHKIDAADGLFDGTPEIDDRGRRAEWVRLGTAELQRLRTLPEPDPVLRPYAAESPAEFFAVATESFFTRPHALLDHHPRLYQALSTHYAQHPAARAPRTA